MNRSKSFIEVDCFQRSAKGNVVSGDVYLQKRHNKRLILVLSDGEGSGIKAHVIASVIASMAINYTVNEEPVLRTAQAIIETFACGPKTADTKQATFTILDIHENGHVKIVEFENPRSVIMKGHTIAGIERKNYKLSTGNTAFSLYVTEFMADDQTRIVVFTDGVTSSGSGTRRMPEGWTREQIQEFLADCVQQKPDVSARELCREVISKAVSNDLFTVRNDMSSLAVYFREPRRILLSSGPPYDDKKDSELALLFRDYEGTKVVCGGTTAQILAREMCTEVETSLKPDVSGLPPTARMKGVDLVTEGVLTLGKLKVLLDALTSTEVSGKGTDARLARMLLEHDIIEFVVGTRINPLHQDPNLPVELELRRNVVKEIARLLETKFMKEVHLKYI